MLHFHLSPHAVLRSSVEIRFIELAVGHGNLISGYFPVRRERMGGLPLIFGNLGTLQDHLNLASINPPRFCIAKLYRKLWKIVEKLLFSIACEVFRRDARRLRSKLRWHRRRGTSPILASASYFTQFK